MKSCIQDKYLCNLRLEKYRIIFISFGRKIPRQIGQLMTGNIGEITQIETRIRSIKFPQNEKNPLTVKVRRQMKVKNLMRNGNSRHERTDYSYKRNDN